jgi:demethylmenaquinone methyltransferase/2-methoxy-6-polyprenyl-1,4-benzoquinol methylase
VALREPRLAAVDRTAEARRLFAPLGPTYERYAALLSYGQDPRWRRFLVSRIEAGPGDRVLDVATGTAAVARELVRKKGCTVVGVDQSPEMLAEARRHTSGHIELVEANAEHLPFDECEFDALTFTYLLRYVDDPAATLAELARVVRPGATVAGLEFGLPSGPWRTLWNLHVGVALPGAGRAIGGGWREVGSFLGPSIRSYWARWPLERQLAAWRDAGIREVSARSLSLGGGVVIWGRKR